MKLSSIPFLLVSALAVSGCVSGGTTMIVSEKIASAILFNGQVILTTSTGATDSFPAADICTEAWVKVSANGATFTILAVGQGRTIDGVVVAGLVCPAGSDGSKGFVLDETPTVETPPEDGDNTGVDPTPGNDDDDVIVVPSPEPGTTDGGHTVPPRDGDVEDNPSPAGDGSNPPPPPVKG